MAQLVVRGLEEVREILRAAVGGEQEGHARLGSALRDRFAGLAVHEQIGVLRGAKPRAARFK
jgi:hypothetical protein